MVVEFVAKLRCTGPYGPVAPVVHPPGGAQHHHNGAAAAQPHQRTLLQVLRTCAAAIAAAGGFISSDINFNENGVNTLLQPKTRC